jgi:hypothetical protein
MAEPIGPVLKWAWALLNAGQPHPAVPEALSRGAHAQLKTAVDLLLHSRRDRGYLRNATHAFIGCARAYEAAAAAAKGEDVTLAQEGRLIAQICTVVCLFAANQPEAGLETLRQSGNTFYEWAHSRYGRLNLVGAPKRSVYEDIEDVERAYVRFAAGLGLRDWSFPNWRNLTFSNATSARADFLPANRQPQRVHVRDGRTAK